jgi:hypothetical protein
LNVIDEISDPLFALGALVLSIGIGFIASAAASFFLSRRLGLLEAPGPRHEPTSATGA